MSRHRVLFLCTGNSARSQMAEGLVNHYLADTWEAVSAGTKPAEQVQPLAIKALAELGIDISSHVPKSVVTFRGEAFDVVITLCDDAAKTCPIWLGEGRVEHMGFPDPAAAEGSEEERLALFRQVRDGIRQRVLSYLEEFKG